MIFLLIADSFPPVMNSAAILIEDLVHEIGENGDHTLLIVPNNSIFHKTKIIFGTNRTILSVRTFNSKSHNLPLRFFSELFNPLLILLAIILNKIKNYDGIIWYSPSIFFGFVIQFLKFKKKVKSYLILRDIFPQWAVDTGVMKKNIIYYFFKFFESYQYKLADRIGIQSISNISYFKKNYPEHLKKIEVLNNWMHKRKPIKTKINLNKTILKGKFVFVYAGNFGKSQQVENLLNIASVFKENKKFGFLFIGNGSEFDRIKDTVKCNLLGNILMLNQVPACELISLYKQCNFGLITLNLRHSTHNTPGKFISYLLSGLPTIAIVNKGNDLIEIINRNNLGIAYSFKNTRFLEKKLLKFIGSINKKKLVSNCISFANKNYSPKKAAIQIINLFR